MEVNVDTIFPRQLLKILPLYYFPKLVLESSEVVRLVVATTAHGRQLLDSLLQFDLMNEFLSESQISVDDLRRVKTASQFWHDITRFPYPEMGDYLPAFLLLNGLNYTEVLKALYHCDIDDLFDEGGRVIAQDLKKTLKKKRPPTADMRMKLLLEGVFDDLGYPFGMHGVAFYRQTLYRKFTKYVRDAFEPLLKKKTMEYFARLEGVMYERARTWPIENEEVRKVYREVVEEQFSNCRLLFIKKGINWEKAQMYFWKSFDEYVTKEQLNRPNANLRRIDEGIEKDAELYSVPPSLMQEIRNSPLLEDYFKKFVKQPKKKPALSKENSREPVVAPTKSSMAKEALSQIRIGRFAGAADIFERILNETKEEEAKHVYNLKLARLFCLYRSSDFDKFEDEVKLLCQREQQCETRYLPKYCLAYFYNERFDFKKSKVFADEVNEEKFLQEQFPEWPEEGGFFDVLQFNSPKCNAAASTDERKKALNRLRNPPAPAAICIYEHCNSSKKEIYQKDPFSSDSYCCFVCTSKCTLQYHFSCWKKMKKECKENYDESALAGSKCFTDGCDGKFETVTIFESDGRVKKRVVSDHCKEKAEGKVKKEKSKKKKGGLSKSDDKGEQIAKQGSSNSMNFPEASTRNEDDASNKEDVGEKIDVDVTEEKGQRHEQAASTKQQGEQEEPELVSKDQLRLLKREDEDDVNEAVSKKKRRNRRQRGNSENKGLLSNTFDVLSLDETGEEKRFSENVWSKRAKSNSHRDSYSTRTMSEASEANLATNVKEITTNLNAQVHNDPFEENVTTHFPNLDSNHGAFGTEPKDTFGYQKDPANDWQPARSGNAFKSTDKIAFEKKKSYESQNKEQPLYGDWSFNEATHGQASNQKDLLPPSLGLNTAKPSYTKSQSATYGGAPNTTKPTFTDNVNVSSNYGKNNHYGGNSSYENAHNVDTFSGQRTSTRGRGRGRGFSETSGFDAPKKTKRIHATSNAPSSQDEKVPFGSKSSDSHEPSTNISNATGPKVPGQYFGSASFEMSTSSQEGLETKSGTFEPSEGKVSTGPVPKTGVFSMFNKAQGISQSGRSKFFGTMSSGTGAPTPKPENTSALSQASTSNTAISAKGSNSHTFVNHATDQTPSTSRQNESFTRSQNPTPTTAFQSIQDRQQNLDHFQENPERSNVHYQPVRPVELSPSTTQQHQQSAFYPDGLGQFTEDRLTDEELRQLMTGGDTFMMTQRPRTTFQNATATPLQNNSAFLVRPNVGSFFQHSQQVPQHNGPSFQPPFRFPAPSVGMPMQPPGMQGGSNFAGIPRGPFGNMTAQFQATSNPFGSLPSSNNAMPGLNIPLGNQLQQFQQGTNAQFFR